MLLSVETAFPTVSDCLSVYLWRTGLQAQFYGGGGFSPLRALLAPNNFRGLCMLNLNEFSKMPFPQ